MEAFAATSTNLRLLICNDVDSVSAAKLSEKYVPQAPKFDGILVLGPFIHNPIMTEEENATALGDMASLIAQFENIVCRVAYLPCEKDPPSTLAEQLHLTPNSVTLHGRRLKLTSNLFVMGFSERSGDTDDGKNSNRPVGMSDEEQDIYEEELQNVQIASARSVSILSEMLQPSIFNDVDASFGGEALARKIDEYSASRNANSTPEKVESGIFVLKYHYAHTLNHFLFHMGHDLQTIGISICIIASNNTDEISRLPKFLGDLAIVVPGSLRQGQYCTIELSFDETTGKWIPIEIESCSLN